MHPSDTRSDAVSRYSVRHWREKEIDSERQRRQGLCPLTPEEAGLFLQALGFNESTHVYIAAGDIYGGQEKMSKLAAMFPNMVSNAMARGRLALRFLLFSRATAISGLYGYRAGECWG